MSNEAKHLKVLVVDDEAPVCKSVEKVLRRKGHDVEQALCVAAALEAMDAGQKFDLIIADLMMPQVGGIELLKATRDKWPDVPVLIITGFASISSAVEATQLGAAGYLPKPFTPDELEKAVDSVVIKGPWKSPESEKAKNNGKGVIDVDLPFDSEEVTKATSPKYVDQLTRSDMPVVQQPAPVALDFCLKGGRNCKKFVAKGECKQDECPFIVAERKKGMRVAAITPMVLDPIDVDMPFSAAEVASMTSESYVAALGPSDMPVTGRWVSQPTVGRRVLVADDEPVVVNSIRKVLARKGYVVDEAFTGLAALARVTGEDYDLVLLDYHYNKEYAFHIFKY